MYDNLSHFTKVRNLLKGSFKVVLKLSFMLNFKLQCVTDLKYLIGYLIQESSVTKNELATIFTQLSTTNT